MRLLKSADNLDDMIMEVPPVEGTLLAFKRADNSWHGHKPFAGERRVIQFNWVTSEGDRRMAMLRHHVSAPLKRLFAAVRHLFVAPSVAVHCRNTGHAMLCLTILPN